MDTLEFLPEFRMACHTGLFLCCVSIGSEGFGEQKEKD
jgi:hypothetical protein